MDSEIEELTADVAAEREALMEIARLTGKMYSHELSLPNDVKREVWIRLLRELIAACVNMDEIIRRTAGKQ